MCEPRQPYKGDARPALGHTDAKGSGCEGSRNSDMARRDFSGASVTCKANEYEVFGALAPLAAGRDEQGLCDLADRLETFVQRR